MVSLLFILALGLLIIVAAPAGLPTVLITISLAYTLLTTFSRIAN